MSKGKDTAVRLWLRSLRRARAAQIGLVRSLYEFDQIELRVSKVILGWPKCSWTYQVIYAREIDRFALVELGARRPIILDSLTALAAYQRRGELPSSHC